MLDPKIIRDNPETVREMLKARSLDFPLDEFLRYDRERRELIVRTDEVRKTRNRISMDNARKKKTNQGVNDLKSQMQSVSKELQRLEETQAATEEAYKRLSLTMPNLVHESVPIGKDESANIVVSKWGKIPSFEFEIRDHIDLAQRLNLIDLERAAKISGARFYFLKNQMVKLNQALLQFALDFLSG